MLTADREIDLQASVFIFTGGVTDWDAATATLRRAGPINPGAVVANSDLLALAAGETVHVGGWPEGAADLRDYPCLSIDSPHILDVGDGNVLLRDQWVAEVVKLEELAETAAIPCAAREVEGPELRGWRISHGDTTGDGTSELLVPSAAAIEVRDSASPSLVLTTVSGGTKIGVVIAEDVDEDGAADLVISDRQVGNEAGGLGAVYCILGPVTSDVTLADAPITWLNDEDGPGPDAMAVWRTTSGMQLATLPHNRPGRLDDRFMMGTHLLSEARMFETDPYMYTEWARPVGDLNQDGWSELLLLAQLEDSSWEWVFVQEGAP